MLRGFTVALSLFLGSGFGASAARLTSARATTGNAGYVNIYGDIKPGDAARFRELVEHLVQDGKTTLVVNVCSRGGSVSEGIDIGSQVARLGGGTKAPDLVANLPATTVQCWLTGTNLDPEIHTSNIDTLEGDKDVGCGSACFLIWAGGTTREGNFIGFTPLDRGRTNLGTDAATTATLRAYLAERQIPVSIIEMMVSPGTGTTHYLDQGELTQTRRLPGGAPQVDEIAASHGVARPVGPAVRPESSPRPASEISAGTEEKLARHWAFFGSRMSMVSEGSKLSFVFDVPRDKLDWLGIKHGSVFFTGHADGSKLEGTIAAYAKDCPTLIYAVTGTLSADDKDIVLRGVRPSRNVRCEITISKEVTVELDAVP